jgi:hypothetical protein
MADSPAMEVVIVVSLVVASAVAVRAGVAARRRRWAAPLPALPEGYTGPVAVKAPRAGRLVAPAGHDGPLAA